MTRMVINGVMNEVIKMVYHEYFRSAAGPRNSAYQTTNMFRNCSVRTLIFMVNGFCLRKHLVRVNSWELESGKLGISCINLRFWVCGTVSELWRLVVGWYVEGYQDRVWAEWPGQVISFILIAIFILIKRVISHPHATPGMPGCHVTPAHIRSSQLTFSRYFYFSHSQIHTIKI